MLRTEKAWGTGGISVRANRPSGLSTTGRFSAVHNTGAEVTDAEYDFQAVSCVEGFGEQVGGNSGEAIVAVASRTIPRHSIPHPFRLRLINLHVGLLKYISLSGGRSLLGYVETDGFVKPLNPFSIDL
jgi:hypothetical protein